MDFDAYFADKQDKLRQQQQQPVASHIFDGITVYITGHTVPSARQLMDLITSNGGQICNFYSGQKSATHIVAESLTSRKCELWRNLSVAKPIWITKSVEQGRLLNWTEFRTVELQINEREWILTERAKVNCLDPGFLDSYYRSSRLHFLSTRKRILRHENHNIGTHTPNKGPQTIVHVDFDSFFVAAALKKRPDLVDKPVAVSHGGDSSDIASCNYVARAVGVKNGMWAGAAKKLCPDLVCLPYDFAAYEEYSNALYLVLRELEPDYICPISVDEALINISNCLHSTVMSLETMIVHIRSKVKQLTGLSVSVGVGPNILVAKMALRMAKPDGCRIFANEHDASLAIAGLPLDALPGIGRMTVHKLEQLGIKRISDIRDHALNELEASLGPALAKKLVAATLAQDTNDISLLNLPAKTAGVDVSWGVRVLTPAEIDIFTSNMLKELWKRLEQDVKIASVSVKVYESEKGAPFLPAKYMGCGSCNVHNRTVKLHPNIEQRDLGDIVKQTIRDLKIAPLRFRGLGVQLKCDDERTPVTPQSKQRRIKDFVPKPPTKREFISLQPKRKLITLTQMANTDQVDMDVFNQLPDDIKQEVVDHADLFNVRVSNQNSNSIKKMRHGKPAPQGYVPVKFLGRNCSESEVRTALKNWIQEYTEGPYHEDAIDFYEFIKQVLCDDWNWLKAISFVDWLDYQIEKHKGGENWKHLLRLVKELIN